MKPKFSFLLIFLSFILTASAQTVFEKDSAVIRKIYDNSLLHGKSYDWLRHLTKEIGPRLSGSENAEEAVRYTKSELEKLGLDKVWLQPVMVPKWVRGNPEQAYVETNSGRQNLSICALGGSVATPENGIKAQVVEVQNFDELKALGREKIEGKIVFFNRPMQANSISTFHAYGGAVGQRWRGAVEAAKYGAKGAIVRSMGLRIDDFPHTGSMSYLDTPEKEHVPAAAISTKDAEYLSGLLEKSPNAELYFKMDCRSMGEVQSYNVIGEITGSEYPEKYIVVGAHLDSWDLAEGAHDDGAGVVQSMEVLRLLKKSGVVPRHTIRAVLFMNEENGLRGGRKYAAEAKRKGENHIFALESDAGGFTPRGFSFDCNKEELRRIREWKPLFKPYFVHYFEQGHTGADIGPLKNESIVLAGLAPDSQRYFDFHHAGNDVFENVNKRELELGAASMAALVYLIDKYGTLASD